MAWPGSRLQENSLAQCRGLSAVCSQLTRLVRNRIAAGILGRPAQHEGASPVAEVMVRQVGAMAAQAVALSVLALYQDRAAEPAAATARQEGATAQP